MTLAEALACLTIDGRGTITDALQEHAGEMVEWLFEELDTCAPDGTSWQWIGLRFLGSRGILA